MGLNCSTCFGLGQNNFNCMSCPSFEPRCVFTSNCSSIPLSTCPSPVSNCMSALQCVYVIVKICLLLCESEVKLRTSVNNKDIL